MSDGDAAPHAGLVYVLQRPESYPAVLIKH